MPSSVDAKGEVGVKVRLAGEEQIFYSSPLLSSSPCTSASCATPPPKSSVVPVSKRRRPLHPSLFTDSQRRAYLDAAEIAGLNPLRLLNDTTAFRPRLRITKTDLPEADNPRNVVFCDIGHSSYQVAVVSFSKGQLTVLGTAADRNFWCRDLTVLCCSTLRRVQGQVQNRRPLQPQGLLPSRCRLRAFEEVLSANAVAPLNVENLMEDIDASSQLKHCG